MRAVLPGKPRATLHALSTARWHGRRLVVYITGNGFVILDRPDRLLQTVYHDEVSTLDGVSIDEDSGKIAVCSKSNVFVYKPYGEDEELLKHSYEFDAADPIRTLSWGTDEELLVGSSYLRLYHTNGDDNLIWERELPCPAAAASFCSDGTLIASYAEYDRLVKIWRRSSVGSDEVQFDFSYLPHPAVVTGLYWRHTGDREHEKKHILYTLCADKKARVWASMTLHGKQTLDLWATIDLQESIQPRYLAPEATSSERYVFFMSGKDFKETIKQALEQPGRQEQKPILEHLIDISGQDPEVCLVTDSKGHMCAWGLQNVGSRNKLPTDVFNIALVENFDIFSLQEERDSNGFATLVNFRSEENLTNYCVLVHRLGGSITWLESSIDDFFDPTPRSSRLHAKALWTGHEGYVNKIIRTLGGGAIVSRTDNSEATVWKQAVRGTDIVLAEQCSLLSPEDIQKTCLLAGGKYVANLHSDSIKLWDATGPKAELAGSCPFKVPGKPLCLLQLPTPEKDSPNRYIATITAELKGIAWEVNIPQLLKTNGSVASVRPSISEFFKIDLGSGHDLAFVLPVDPAGSRPIAGGFLDTFAKDVALSYTTSGVLSTWTARLDLIRKRVDWLATATVKTDIPHPALASGSSIRKIALVNEARDGLTIWDTRSGQLEYEKKFGVGDPVQDLDWTATPDDQSILAIGFPYKVVIMGQIRYDYLSGGPAWAPIRSIRTRDLTPHPIGDSTWLGNGNLVIGAGNQLFLYDKVVVTPESGRQESAAGTEVKELAMPVVHGSSKKMDLFDVVSVLNGPLAVYHPQFLSQCILAGNMDLARRIIVRLHRALKFFSDGDELSSNLDLPLEDFLNEEENQAMSKSQVYSSGDDDEDADDTVSENLAAALNDNLTHKSVPYLTSREQFILTDLVECVATADQHRRSMDDNAMRYLLFFRQHMIRKEQSRLERDGHHHRHGKGIETPAPEVPGSRKGSDTPKSTSSGRRIDIEGEGVSWREFAWAFYSESQDILTDLTSRHFNGKMRWEHVRECGMFMWMTDITALKIQFENVARNEYARTDERNPVDCSLHYLALKKKNVLIGLWRMATWHREQAGTQRLLRNDFSEARWKSAALKNAYALMGKRRFEYAAAFFLLGGSLSDAVNVLATQVGDIQLAIAVARVHEGTNEAGPVLKGLLENVVLPRAAEEGNRWMANWAFWMLGRRDMAVRALITPVYTLIDRPPTPSQEAKSYLATDPALVVIYRQLREKTLQALKGATEVMPRAEWEFVIQIARLLDRMGCDLLALNLVRNWPFLNPITPAQRRGSVASPSAVPQPHLLLRRRSSMVVADMPVSPSQVMAGGPSAAAAANPAVKVGFMAGMGLKAQAAQPPPSVFEEPEANSLLDSFGF